MLTLVISYQLMTAGEYHFKTDESLEYLSLARVVRLSAITYSLYPASILATQRDAERLHQWDVRSTLLTQFRASQYTSGSDDNRDNFACAPVL